MMNNGHGCGLFRGNTSPASCRLDVSGKARIDIHCLKTRYRDTVQPASETTGLTVGVITHERSRLFADLLGHLRGAVIHLHGRLPDVGQCRLLVVNNSGAASRSTVDALVSESAIGEVCTVTIVDSPENNISVGRNLVLEHAKTRWLVFVDDDEYPEPQWLYALLEQQRLSGSAVVAGPIEPVYPPGTPRWVAALDLHNKGNLKTGDRVRRVATGNCLLDLPQIGDHRFDRAFGLSGGSDALFFDQLAERGLHVVWREDAIVHETIPAARTGSRYMMFRCMTQGHNYKRVVLRDAAWPERGLFFLKATLVAPVSLLVGGVALPLDSQLSARWLKRGFTNLGKLLRPSRRLYG